MRKSELKDIIKEEFLKEISDKEKQYQKDIIRKIEDSITYLDYVGKTEGFEKYGNESKMIAISLKKLLKNLKIESLKR